MQNERKHEVLEQVKSTINRVFVGKEEVVEKILICLLAGGHILYLRHKWIVL